MKRLRLIDIRFKIYYLTLFRIKTYIRRKVYFYLNFNRPTSYPFITGDSFRSMAQHVFDESSDIDGDTVINGDIVFVRSDLLHTYFRTVHPSIKHRYILISHNSDQNINSNYEKYIDDKIIHWFAQNLLIDHVKMTPIPIGLQLRLYDRKNTVIDSIKNWTFNRHKKHNIFYSFSLETNTKRDLALESLKLNPLSSGSEKRLSKEVYYSHIASSTFVASPEGNGIDCHRTWESLYLNAIPILEKNVSTQYWNDIGLPVLLIDSWTDIEKIDKDVLSEFYEKNKDKFNSPAIYMDYWVKEIYKYTK
jgi:hypothetical protein